MFRAACCASILLLACPERPSPAEKSDVPVVPAPTETTSDTGRVIDLTNQGVVGASIGAPERELEPREGRDTCDEMYTVCLPDGKGENCTSARLELECGESGRIPTTGERLKCICR
jgi:hypothetical protein